ncbi:hypothetical protein HDU76_002988 [Blyttiomyces sp. JEL0837]|nr:hypothetical protein HDU76_002988 [Blyttiomyces sp. JEL0837]
MTASSKGLQTRPSFMGGGTGESGSSNFGRSQSGPSNFGRSQMGPSATGSNNVPVNTSKRRGQERSGDDEEMDEEDRRRYEQGMRKKDAKMFRKGREADLEELVPKATGRDAMIEKKRTINAYHKQERDVDAALPESVLLGGGDSFEAALARERKRKEKYEEKKQVRQNVMQEKVSAYQAKEDATMAMLRELAERNRKT